MRRLTVVLAGLLLILVGWSATARAAEATHGTGTAPAEQVGSAPVEHGHGSAASTGAGESHKGEGHAKPAGGIPEPPNLIAILLHTEINGKPLADTHVGHFLHRFEKQIFLVFYTIMLSILIFGTLRLRALTPGRLQTFLEMIVEGFYGFITGILGSSGKKYVPFLATLWVFIFTNTLMGVVPFLTATTSIFQTTVTLAIIVFFYVHFNGILENSRHSRFWILGGVARWLHHFAGSPKDLTGWVMAPLMFVLHIIGELAKPLSLSLRLFGNIMGEDILLGVFLILGVLMGHIFGPHPIVGFPLHLPFFFLALLTSAIQATVFTLLSSIYLMMVLPHEEHEEAGGGHAEHGPARPGMATDAPPHVSSDAAPLT